MRRMPWLRDNYLDITKKISTLQNSFLQTQKRQKTLSSVFFLIGISKLFYKEISTLEYIREVINISPIKYLIFVGSKEH